MKYIKLFEEYDTDIFKKYETNIVKAKKEFFASIHGMLYHGTTKKNAGIILKEGFIKNEFNYFLDYKPGDGEEEMSYGNTIIVVDPNDFIDRLWPDWEGVWKDPDNKEIEEIENIIDSKLAKLSVEKGTNFITQLIMARINPDILFYLWEKSEQSMGWVVIKGKILPDKIKEVFTI